ncbi:3-deoxy-D-manno-octulosonate 8-phosphate phosphatase [Chitinophaga caeni]|uniref:3-deoxy-D-manno-octulosonate 8-phosphate phosphatase n=1 Tax=Chitinophaga caeni TaxID=2029983 RepID=A0A291R035_9BACT|nr:HAD hydrolase family protein [Chitinophaga caeni]ATL49502.1 3-deoxy-D-manno-octulosonate 8-phosphate phosphatase [Chitinophaga caeni]
MNILEQFRPIRTFIFDVDGVLTDGTVQLMPNGDLSRKMNTRDGYALQLAVKKGYRIVIITGGKSESVVSRLKDLGIRDIYTAVVDKKEQLSDYAMMNDLSWDEMLYMGDDLPDFFAMQMVALATCPSDAAQEIKSICKYISPFRGGDGCAREVIEKVLKLNGDWLIDDTISSK